MPVVVNHEEQYMVWPSDKPIPKGWKQVGRAGTKAECLALIRKLTTKTVKPRKKAGGTRKKAATKKTAAKKR